MIYYLLAILLLTILFIGLYRAKVLNICAICAAVVLTWVGGITALYANAGWADPLILAILMGASMGAVADKYGKRFGLLWKSAMILLGLPAIYFIVQKSVWVGLGLMAIMAAVTIFSKPKSKPSENNQKDLFEGCC